MKDMCIHAFKQQRQLVLKKKSSGRANTTRASPKKQLHGGASSRNSPNSNLRHNKQLASKNPHQPKSRNKRQKRSQPPRQRLLLTTNSNSTKTARTQTPPTTGPNLPTTTHPQENSGAISQTSIEAMATKETEEGGKTPAGEEFEPFGFKISEGERYLGGFIGSPELQTQWVEDKMEEWKLAITNLASIACRYPQTAYAGLTKSLQHEWQFLHRRVVPELVDKSKSLENSLTSSFLAALLKIDPSKIDYQMRRFSILPVKAAGPAFMEPTRTARDSWISSTVLCGHIVASLRGGEAFRRETHEQIVQEARLDIRMTNARKAVDKASLWLDQIPDDKARIIRQGMGTGAWLSAYPSEYNGTTLSSQEWCDALCLRYGISPPHLLESCDGCAAKFSINHALSCKKGGLVTQRHNAIRNELSFIAAKALAPSAVRDEPFIHPGHAATKDNTNATEPLSTNNTFNDDRGNILIGNLWANNTSCIMDVRVTDVDAPSYKNSKSGNVLRSQETAKKKKYLSACHENCRHFTPFVCSTDGLLGEEANRLGKRLASMLALKWRRPYSQICGWIHARMSIAIVRATHTCIRGSRVPASQISSRQPFLEEGAGMAFSRFL